MIFCVLVEPLFEKKVNDVSIKITSHDPYSPPLIRFEGANYSTNGVCHDLHQRGDQFGQLKAPQNLTQWVGIEQTSNLVSM